MTTRLRKIVTFTPAYHGNHQTVGKGAMKVHFALVGKEGATTLTINLGIHIDPADDYAPKVTDISTHSRKPFSSQDMALQECAYTGGKCYLKTSSLEAVPLLPRFIQEGDEVIWEELLKRYRRDLRGETS